MLTWSQVLAPSGWPLHGLGVLPVVCTSLGPDVLAAGLTGLGSGLAPMGSALRQQRAARPPLGAADAAALRGACPPAEGRSADLAAAQALIENPRAYAAALATVGR
jgi:carboxyl-terminal processing protease